MDFIHILLILIFIVILCILLFNGSLIKIVGGEEVKEPIKIKVTNRKVYITEINPTINEVKYHDNLFDTNEVWYVKGFMYKNIKSDIQIQQIVNFGNIEEYSRLVKLLGKYINQKGIARINILRNLLTKKSDLEVYKEINKHLKRNEDVRAYNQAQQLFRGIVWLMDRTNFNPTKYLDYGCGSGLITVELKRMLHLEKVDCIEVNKSLQNAEIDYHYVPDFYKKKIEDYKLPYVDGTFDLVTAFNSLHHTRNLESMIKELHRIMKPGGYLIIREHDCWNAFDAMLVDIEHAIFMHHNNENFDEYYITYKNYFGWDLVLNKYFKYTYADNYYTSLRNEISPTRGWYGFYMRI
jgi:SAM-dependent methyltransferase